MQHHKQNIGKNMNVEGSSDDRNEETFLSSERNEEHVMKNGGKEILSIEWRKLSWTECYVYLEADFISNELGHLTEEIPKKVIQGWNSNTQYSFGDQVFTELIKLKWDH